MFTKKQTKIIEWISFLGLCILAIYFMWGVMGKFLSNKTSFTQTEEPMKELPTIVFCSSKGAFINHVDIREIGYLTDSKKVEISTIL